MIGQTHKERIPVPTKKRSTDQAAAVLDAKLRAAMEEAHIAGGNDFEKFMRTSRLVQDGIVYDTAGWAFVKVRSPAYHFRESLKRLYPSARGSGGKWTLNIGFGKKPSNMNQSMTADEVYAGAAARVMWAHFPDQEFIVDSHMD